MQLDKLPEGREEPATAARLRRWALVAVVTAVFLTVLLSFLSWRAAQQAAETADWVAHSYEVATLLESTLRHSLDVETGGRGFAGTGNVSFLEPYQSGRPAVAQDLQALRKLLVTPDQLQRFKVLEEQANTQLADVAEIVTTRQNTGNIPTLALFAQGKHEMDAVRITVARMEISERALLAQRTQRAYAARHASSVVIACGSLLGVIFLCIAGMAVSRESARSAQARAEVRARNADRETRERLAAIVDSSEDAIVSKTLDGMITAWNRGAEKLFGYSAAEIVGKPVLVLLPPHCIEEEAGLLARIRRGETIDHFETVRVRKDGSSIDVSETISPIRDDRGVIVGASKIARDITRRKHAEEALREKEQRLSESQRIAHIGSWSLDPRNLAGPLIWSDELYRMYGVSRDTFTPTIEELLQVIVPEDRSSMQKWWAACAAGDQPGDLAFRMRRPDGALRVFCRRGELQYDRDHKPIRMVGTSQDITERRETEDCLRESQERFQAMANGIQQLAWMANADGSIFWYNQRWYDYTGTTREETLGWTWEKIHDPAFLPKVLERWKEAIATGTPFDMESMPC